MAVVFLGQELMVLLQPRKRVGPSIVLELAHSNLVLKRFPLGPSTTSLVVNEWARVRNIRLVEEEARARSPAENLRAQGLFTNYPLRYRLGPRLLSRRLTEMLQTLQIHLDQCTIQSLEKAHILVLA